MIETIESVSKWADETFGKTTVEASRRRALEEIQEFREQIIDHKIVEEAADVCITLYRLIALLDPLAIEKKMATNRSRHWVLNGDGTGYHIKERESNP